LSHPLRWGIDLGGTKIEGVVLLPDGIRPLARLRVPTESHLGYSHIVDQVGVVIERLESATGLRRPQRIGIGTPGTTDPATGRLKNSNTTVLNGRRFISDLEASHGTMFAAANDANCFALAEAVLGAARGYETVFGVIMGTGVGGGLVVRGKVLNGAMGIAGEWGHNTLDSDGDPCYCGKVGCVETILSGPALERYYHRIGGEPRSLREIAARIDVDEFADATIDRLITGFGTAIANVINIFDPHAIVLGGGVNNLPYVRKFAASAAKPHVFNPAVRTKFLRPKLGDSAGVFGAAMLAG